MAKILEFTWAGDYVSLNLKHIIYIRKVVPSLEGPFGIYVRFVDGGFMEFRGSESEVVELRAVIMNKLRGYEA